ncbi:hypothetical protein JCM10213_002594 [Rhodosporidiobolus nylandii]
MNPRDANKVKRPTRRLDPTRPAFPLPAELVLRVLEELTDDPDEAANDTKRDLAACCLVSRTFANLARPLLYEDIDLTARDLAQVTPLFHSLQKGHARFVRELHVGEPFSSEEIVLRESVFKAFQSCTRIVLFWTCMTFCGNDLRDLLVLCLPRWTALTTLWLRAVHIQGELLHKAPNLKELSIGSLDFKASTRASFPPPFQLHTLHVVDIHRMTTADFLFLTSSSQSSLRALEIQPVQDYTNLPLNGLTCLKELTLIVREVLDFLEFDAVVRILRGVPSSLSCVRIAVEDHLSESGELLYDMDFLRSLPSTLTSLDLSSLPPLPPSYVADCLEDKAFLTGLESMECSYEAEDEEEDGEAWETAAWRILQARPGLRFEFVNRALDDDDD